MYYINKSEEVYLSKDKIDAIISNKFELDCINIELFQQKELNALNFKGPGTIFLDESGKLNLKMYVKIDDEEKAWFTTERDYTPGKIIEKENFFSLRAVAGCGAEWISDNIMISRDFSLPTKSIIIKAKLAEIRNIVTFDRQKNDNKNYLNIIIPEKYDIPCNKKADLPAGGWSLSKLEFSACKINFEFEQRDKYLLIYAEYSLDADLKDIEYLIQEALSIIVGDFVRPQIIESYNGNTESAKIRSREDNRFGNKGFPAPYRYYDIDNIEPFVSFFEKYLLARKKISMDLIGFWHKIFKAWQSGIDSAALPLTVSIEGMVKTYFLKHGLPDNKILEQIGNAEEKVKDIQWEGEIGSRLLSALAYIKKSSPKCALYGMAKNEFFPKEWVVVWSKLRNRSAHADKINQSEKKIQEHIDQIYTCFALYYRMMYIIIGYDGKFTNYSKEGWHEEEFIISE